MSSHVLSHLIQIGQYIKILGPYRKKEMYMRASRKNIPQLFNRVCSRFELLVVACIEHPDNFNLNENVLSLKNKFKDLVIELKVLSGSFQKRTNATEVIIKNKLYDMYDGMQFQEALIPEMSARGPRLRYFWSVVRNHDWEATVKSASRSLSASSIQRKAAKLKEQHGSNPGQVLLEMRMEQLLKGGRPTSEETLIAEMDYLLDAGKQSARSDAASCTVDGMQLAEAVYANNSPANKELTIELSADKGVFAFCHKKLEINFFELLNHVPEVKAIYAQALTYSSMKSKVTTLLSQLCFNVPADINAEAEEWLIRQEVQKLFASLQQLVEEGKKAAELKRKAAEKAELEVARQALDKLSASARKAILKHADKLK